MLETIVITALVAAVVSALITVGLTNRHLNHVDQAVDERLIAHHRAIAAEVATRRDTRRPPGTGPEPPHRTTHIGGPQ